MKTNVTCESIEPLLTAYHLDELPAEQAAMVAGHLDVCPACGAASDEIAATLEVVCEALATAPAGASQLDTRRREAALADRRRTWVVKIREALDLPATGPIPSDLWPGALAKAAIVFLIPLTVAVGLLVPGLRAMKHQAVAQKQYEKVYEEKAFKPHDGPAYEVDILQMPQLAEREAIQPAATGDAVAVSTTTLDGIAEQFHPPVIADADLIVPGKLGLARPDQHEAANLVNTTALVAAEASRNRTEAARLNADAELATQQRKMASHIKTDGKPRLVNTTAAKPAFTNREPIFSSPKK